MLLIGEKINGTRQEVGEAVRERDAARIAALAVAQTEAGAGCLDLNAGTQSDREPDDLAWLVRTVQGVVDVPLCLDSANPTALSAALAETRHPPLINSISGEHDRLASIIPLAVDHGCRLIALALDADGIPPTPDGRCTVVKRILDATAAAGIEDTRVYVDPLVLAVATDHRSAVTALETLTRIRSDHPEVHLTCGLSNVSFGMPLRGWINQAFLTLALAAGLDSAICDPTDRPLLSALRAAEVVLGRDRHCLTYNRAYRANRLHPLDQTPPRTGSTEP